jgi:cytochrome c
MLPDRFYRLQKRIIGTASIILGCMLGLSYTQTTVNQPPRVTITQPHENSIHARQTQIRYQISVSDAEDGESVYQEIPGKAVFLELLFRAGDPPALQKPSPEGFPKDQAFDRMKQNQCFTCHSLKGPFTGPSFASIANRYRHDPAGRQTAAIRIIEGSRGIWGDPVMPGTPAVSPGEAEAMIAWMSENADRKDYQVLVGMEGNLTIDPPKGMMTGHILLRASYLDRGIEGNPGLYQKGTDIRIIKFQ